MDWLMKMDEVYKRLYARLHIDDKRHEEGMCVRFMIRIATFLMKGYYNDTCVGRSERLLRWKEARRLLDRVDYSLAKGLPQKNRIVIWILTHRLELPADPFLRMFCKMAT